MKQQRSILILLAAGLLLGMLTFRNYGESWDDLSLQKYAAKSLRAYSTWLTQGQTNLTREDLGYYGPSYVMAVDLLSDTPEQRHLIYFVTFLAGVWSFHQLSRRWLSPSAAVGAALLFSTQPLLWGHAFINPKDTPFLAFFLLSLYFGIKLFDSPDLVQLNRIDSPHKRTLALLASGWLVLTMGLFLFTDSFHQLLTNLVESAGAGEANIISLIASDIAKVDSSIYVQRYFTFFLWARLSFFLLSSFFALSFIFRNSKPVFHSLRSILLPAFLLGFTTSLRILAPFAIVFIAYYAFRKHGKNAFIPLGLYGIFALIAVYLTWPYLWENPIGHFVGSFREMSQYPWAGTVLFNGVEYKAADLPVSYLPALLGLQLTEPVWALTLLGLFAAGFGRGERRELVWMSLVWFAIPLAGFIVMNITLYDNFRQVLFILPPVFMLAGAAFERIENKKWRALAIALCVLPGLIGMFRLHPYEYAYYNVFAGDVFRRYETDYWGTSYREAALYVNDVAPDGAVVWVEGPSHLFEMYARDDIKVYSDHEADRADHYDYVVSLTRYNLDLESYADARVIHEIKRGGMIFAVIKQLENQ